MDISQVKAALDERGIEYKATASAKKLVKILNEALEAAGEDTVELTETALVNEKEKNSKADKKSKTITEPNGARVDPPNRVPDYAPPPVAQPIKGRTFPGETGGEYKSVQKVAGKTQSITMLLNVRHDGKRFLKDEKYEVPVEIAEQFINESWAE